MFSIEKLHQLPIVASALKGDWNAKSTVILCAEDGRLYVNITAFDYLADDPFDAVDKHLAKNHRAQLVAANLRKVPGKDEVRCTMIPASKMSSLSKTLMRLDHFLQAMENFPERKKVLSILKLDVNLLFESAVVMNADIDSDSNDVADELVKMSFGITILKEADEDRAASHRISKMHCFEHEVISKFNIKLKVFRKLASECSIHYAVSPKVPSDAYLMEVEKDLFTPYKKYRVYQLSDVITVLITARHPMFTDTITVLTETYIRRLGQICADRKIETDGVKRAADGAMMPIESLTMKSLDIIDKTLAPTKVTASGIDAVRKLGAEQRREVLATNVQLGEIDKKVQLALRDDASKDDDEVVDLDSDVEEVNSTPNEEEMHRVFLYVQSIGTLGDYPRKEGTGREYLDKCSNFTSTHGTNADLESEPIFRIGQTTDIEKRKKNHLSRYNKFSNRGLIDDDNVFYIPIGDSVINREGVLGAERFLHTQLAAVTDVYWANKGFSFDTTDTKGTSTETFMVRSDSIDSFHSVLKAVKLSYRTTASLAETMRTAGVSYLDTLCRISKKGSDDAYRSAMMAATAGNFGAAANVLVKAQRLNEQVLTSQHDKYTTVIVSNLVAHKDEVVASDRRGYDAQIAIQSATHTALVHEIKSASMAAIEKAETMAKEATAKAETMAKEATAKAETAIKEANAKLEASAKDANSKAEELAKDAVAKAEARVAEELANARAVRAELDALKNMILAKALAQFQ